MKVRVMRSYHEIGEFDLDAMSNEVLGAIVRAMVEKADKADEYKQVSIEPVKEDES